MERSFVLLLQECSSFDALFEFSCLELLYNRKLLRIMYMFYCLFSHFLNTVKLLMCNQLSNVLHRNILATTSGWKVIDCPN